MQCRRFELCAVTETSQVSETYEVLDQDSGGFFPSRIFGVLPSIPGHKRDKKFKFKIWYKNRKFNSIGIDGDIRIKGQDRGVLVNRGSGGGGIDFGRDFNLHSLTGRKRSDINRHCARTGVRSERAHAGFCVDDIQHRGEDVGYLSVDGNGGANVGERDSKMDPFTDIHARAVDFEDEIVVLRGLDGD